MGRSRRRWRDAVLSRDERSADPLELAGIAAAELMTIATALTVAIL